MAKFKYIGEHKQKSTQTLYEQCQVLKIWLIVGWAIALLLTGIMIQKGWIHAR